MTIAAALLLLAQAAAPAAGAPATGVSVPAAPALQPASPRTLIGRFMCDATVYEVQVTAAVLGSAGVVLDRAVAGRAIDAGSLAEARRMVARLGDVQSLDVRCRSDGAGELSIYGTQGTGAAMRRARVRGTLKDGRISGLTVAVQR